MKIETQEVIEGLNKLQHIYLEQVRALFFKEVEKVFAAYPLVTSFGFRAYEQHFNDGEETSFQVYADLDEYGLVINGFPMGYGPYSDEDLEDEDEENDYSRYFDRDSSEVNLWKEGNVFYDYKERALKGDENIIKVIKGVQRFIWAFDVDIWKTIVGDHVITRFTKDSMEVKSYNHN